MPKLKRAVSIQELYATKRNILQFTGLWESHIGCPEQKGSWIIYGHSGNGKTSYCVQLAHYLAQFDKVAYNSLEEGNSESFTKACQRVGMETVAKNFEFITDDKEVLPQRLQRRNSAKFVFIDSFQYYGINYNEYKKLKEQFPNKVFIYVCHAEGKKPEGRIAKRVEYDANVKIWVQGYKAFPKSRYGGTEPFVIYPERAAEYWEDIK